MGHVHVYVHVHVLFIARGLMYMYVLQWGLSLSFVLLAALIFTLVTNLLLCGWVLSTAAKFIRSIKCISGMLGQNRCHRLWPSMIALRRIRKLQNMHSYMYLITNCSLDEAKEDFICGFGFPGFWPVSYASQVWWVIRQQTAACFALGKLLSFHQFLTPAREH